MKKGRCAVTGALAGAANGLFGAGGGLFLVPLLTRWAKLDTSRALATSIAVILPLSVVSLVVYALRGDADFFAALPFAIGGVVGGLLGGRWFPKVSAVWLRRALGALIIYGGVKAVLLL